MPTWLLWIFLAGAVAGLAYFLYAFFIEEEDEDDEEGEPGYDGGATMLDGGRADTLGETLLSTAKEERAARRSRMLALKDSLERSLEGKEGEAAETTDRMSMPWFLLIGASGSGKTTMLANTGLPLPYGPAFEVDSRKRDAGRWWLFQDAVVLEAPAASSAIAASDSTLPPGQTIGTDTSEGWNTLLHMLRKERPDAPLNGIIVTVSCADLVAGGRDSERLAETADRIRTFLERTRNTLEVRLPLHVIVTKCDVLAGFRSFAENLPAERRSDIFGWANPEPIETPFNPSWVDIGCEAMRKELEDLRDEVLAAPDVIKDADGLFVFVSEFANIQEPLRDFVSRLYNDSDKRPPLFFRGMYFCGDTIDPEVHKSASKELLAAGKSRATMQLSAEVALTGSTRTNNLVFLKALFTEKIFKEAGLSRPLARFRLSRDRRVVVAQAAAALIALVGTAGLYTTLNGFRRGDAVVQEGLRTQADALAHAFAGMAIDLDEIKRNGVDTTSDRRSEDAAVIELVDEMRGLHAIKRSPFIPASWFDPLPTDVKTSLQAGVQDIVLPVIRQRLDERLRNLLDTADTEAASDADAVMANPQILAEYLDEVRLLSSQVNAYNRLAKAGSGTQADLSSLLDYLFAVQVDTGAASGVTDDFRRALRESSAPLIVFPPQVAAVVVGRSMRLVASLGEQAGKQLAKPQARDARPDPAADLNALRQLKTLVELSDPRRGIVAAVSDSLILGANIARQVQDSISAQVRRAAMRMSGDTLAAALQANRLRDAIDTLFSLRLMDVIEPGEIVADFAPHNHLLWDVGRLELALSLRKEYVRAVVTVLNTMPGQSEERVRRAFDPQFRDRLLAAVANAQRITPIPPGNVPSAAVKYGADNLEAAVPRLFTLSRVMDSLKLGDNGSRIIQAATRQAEQALVTAQGIMETDNTLLPQADKVAAWQGVIPVSWAAVNAPDSLRFETARLPLEGLIRSLTSSVAPALAFLTRPGSSGDVRVPALVAEWTALTANMARYEKADGNSSPAMLRRYLSGEMSARDMATCATNAVQADTVKAGSDPFLLRRRQFRAALVGRCGGGGPEAVKAYERLRATFTTRIAGRYPFVDSTHTLAPDVDPAALADFLAQYDAFMATSEVALRSDPTLAATTQAPLAFLAALKPVRAFYAGLLADKRTPRALVVVPAEDSVMNRELNVAGRAIALDEESHDFAWRYGDDVRLTVRDSARSRSVMSATMGWSVVPLARVPGVRFFNPVTRAELLPPMGYPTAAPEVGAATPVPVIAAPAAPPIPAGASPAPAQPASAESKAPLPASTKAKAPDTKSGATKSGTLKTGTKGATKAKSGPARGGKATPKAPPRSKAKAPSGALF